jgi:DNA-binding transcriptional LysR family regulator
MDLKQLAVYVAVAEDLHFGRAAERLHLAQPHVSRTVRALEAELEAPLFSRTSRRVQLTAAGAALLDHARTMLETEQRARSAVTAAREGRSGRVRIGFAGPSAHVMVGELARGIRERHPLIDLEFLPGRHGSRAVGELHDGRADLVIARFARPPAGVASRGVERDRCVVAVPAGHPLAAKGRIGFADMRDEPFVAFPESYGSVVRSVFVDRCHAAGFAPRFVQSIPDTWTGVALVSAGVGMHFTMARAIAHLPLDGVAICELADDLPLIEVFLIWRRGDDDPALARVLRTSEELLPTVP